MTARVLDRRIDEFHKRGRRASLLAHLTGKATSPVITAEHFAYLLKVSKRTFYSYQHAGLLDGLEAPAPHLYSWAKVEARMAGQPLRGRYRR